METIRALIACTVRELPHIFFVHHGVIDSLVHAHIMQHHAIKHFYTGTRLSDAQRVFSIIEPDEIFLVRQAEGFHDPSWNQYRYKRALSDHY